MKKTILTLLAVLIIFKLSYSQEETFYRDKKLSTWGKISFDNVEMNSVSFSIDEKFLAAAGQMGSLIIWNLENGNIQFDLSDTTKDKSYFIRDVEYSPNGKYLATVGSTVYLKSKIVERSGVSTVESEGKAIERKVLRIYETNHYSIIKEISYDTIADMFSCVFSPDSKYLITGENQTIKNNISFIRVYETNNWMEKSKFELDFIPWEISLNSSGEQLYLGSNDGFLKIYDFKNGKLTLNQQIKLNDDEISSISVSPNNQNYSINQDSLFLYKLNSKEKIFINYQEYRQYSCSFSPDKILIAYGGDKNDCSIYNLESKSIIQELQGDTDNVYQNEDGYNITRLIFSDSGKIIAMLNDVGMIYIFRKK